MGWVAPVNTGATGNVLRAEGETFYDDMRSKIMDLTEQINRMEKKRKEATESNDYATYALFRDVCESLKELAGYLGATAVEEAGEKKRKEQ